MRLLSVFLIFIPALFFAQTEKKSKEVPYAVIDTPPIPIGCKKTDKKIVFKCISSYIEDFLKTEIIKYDDLYFDETIFTWPYTKMPILVKIDEQGKTKLRGLNVEDEFMGRYNGWRQKLNNLIIQIPKMQPAKYEGEVVSVLIRFEIPLKIIKPPLYKIGPAGSKTDIYVNSGDKLTFKSWGEVTYGIFAGDGGPDGINGFKNYNISRSYNHGALLGKIGQDGELFLIGKGTTYNAHNSGVLFLYINDKETSNNTGNLIVAIAKK